MKLKKYKTKESRVFIMDPFYRRWWCIFYTVINIANLVK